MSAALVRKSLAIVDSDKIQAPKKKSLLLPQNHRVVRTVVRKGRKEKVGLLQTGKKLTVNEARKQYKSKDLVLKENLKKLRAVKRAAKIHLDEQLTVQLIERAVSRRPVSLKKKKKKVEATAFTEEDFKKFEEEYTGDD